MFGLGYNTYLPPGVLPTDFPMIDQLLENLDPLDHRAHVTDETAFVTAFIDRSNWNPNAQERVPLKLDS